MNVFFDGAGDIEGALVADAKDVEQYSALAVKAREIVGVFTTYSVISNPDMPDFRIGPVFIRRAHRNRLYVLFLEDCGQRFHFAREMAAVYARQRLRNTTLRVREAISRPVDDLRKIFFAPGKPKFTRRQCIVRVDLKFGKNGMAHSRKYMFSDFALKYGLENYPRFSAFTFSSTGETMYIQYYDSCDRRLEMTRELTAAYKRKYPDAFDFVISEKTIEPGRDTIDASGGMWLDAYPGRRR